MAAILNFYRGPKASYVYDTHCDGIYFCTDTLEILMNEGSYGGGLTGISFADGELTFTFANGEETVVPIDLATDELPGLMSAADKIKLDALPDADTLDSEITAVQTELDDTQTGAGLADDGSYVVDSEDAILSSAMSLANADTLLSTAISDETTRATEAEEKLSESIEALADSLEYEDSYATGEFVGAISIKDSSVTVEKKALSLEYDSSTDDLSISDGTDNFTTVSLSDLREAIDANTELIIDLHASVLLTASQIVIEKGADTSVTFTGTASFNGSTELITEMDIYDNSSASGTAVATETTSPVTYTATLSDSATYSVKAVVSDVEKTATRTVNAYYPIYIVTSADTPTASMITDGTKQAISSTATGTYTITTEEGDYVWLCVPDGVTVPTSATMSSFDCPITNDGTVSGVSVNGASVTYTLVRTTNAMKADTLTITYS